MTIMWSANYIKLKLLFYNSLVIYKIYTTKIFDSRDQNDVHWWVKIYQNGKNQKALEW